MRKKVILLGLMLLLIFCSGNRNNVILKSLTADIKKEMPERLKVVPESKYEAEFNALLVEQNKLIDEWLNLQKQKQEYKNALAEGMTYYHAVNIRGALAEIALDEKRNKNKRYNIKKELLNLCGIINAGNNEPDL